MCTCKSTCPTFSSGPRPQPRLQEDAGLAPRRLPSLVSRRLVSELARTESSDHFLLYGVLGCKANSTFQPNLNSLKTTIKEQLALLDRQVATRAYRALKDQGGETFEGRERLNKKMISCMYMCLPVKKKIAQYLDF